MSTLGGLMSTLAPGLIGYHVPPGAETSGCCLVRLGHKVAGYKTLGGIGIQEILWQYLGPIHY